jgi:hypothetical protein
MKHLKGFLNEHKYHFKIVNYYCKNNIDDRKDLEQEIMIQLYCTKKYNDTYVE